MTKVSALEDRRVLVTAAGSGIGLTIARQFSSAGARVMICDIDPTGIGALDDLETSICDVSSQSDVDRLFDQVRALLGGLDILVNNAGIGGPMGPLESLDVPEWQHTIETNLYGAYYCCRRAIPLLKEAGGGSIVNLASTAGFYGVPNRTPYVASKWGLIGLTKSLAAELGSAGIRVNAICPGSVSGDRIDRVISAESSLRDLPEDAVRTEFVRSNSMRTMIDAEDVAALALFLCSKQGRFISGQAIGVDGNTETKW